MRYEEHPPSDNLGTYIDAYWILETNSFFKPTSRRIFADGCMEIIINVGYSKPLINYYQELMPQMMYVGGTMSSYSIFSSLPDTSFLGIRFKPAGFPAFYKMPFEEMVNNIIEFHDSHLMSIVDIDPNVFERLNFFFAKKLNPAQATLVPIRNTICRYKGIISVSALANEHNITIRTMERLFKKETGVSPKSLINIVKFQHASSFIRKDANNSSLLSLAFKTGYFDHSHLIREIKKHTGLTPSELMLMGQISN